MTDENREITPVVRLWALASHHQVEARLADHGGRFELAQYHAGKAFAYEHAARMLEGTDAS